MNRPGRQNWCELNTNYCIVIVAVYYIPWPLSSLPSPIKCILLFIVRALTRPDEYLTHELSTCMCVCACVMKTTLPVISDVPHSPEPGPDGRLYVYFNSQLRCVDTHTHTRARIRMPLSCAKCVELMWWGTRNCEHFSLLNAIAASASAALNQITDHITWARACVFSSQTVVIWFYNNVAVPGPAKWFRWKRVRVCGHFLPCTDDREPLTTTNDDDTRMRVAETTPSFYGLTNRRMLNGSP